MLLIDTYNVLHLPEAQLQGGELSIEDLCALIGASRYAGGRILLVCDGSPPARLRVPPRASAGALRFRIAGADVIFAGRGRSADDEIEDRLRASRGSGVVLVSDDRRLTRAASRSRARSLGSATFLAHLLVDREGRGRTLRPRFSKDIPLDAYSVEHWRREFGLAPADPARAARRPPERKAGPAGTSRAEHGGPAQPRERSQAPAPEAGRQPRPGSDPRLEALLSDPLIREALEAWNGRLRVEDLDMRRWLGEGPGTGAGGG
ncbi:MAG TPA: hypothetical protein VFF69_12655 [Phycisphaerales bacterium]|nr:hypothetical protein [Phycisphaerales bacterium]